MSHTWIIEKFVKGKWIPYSTSFYTRERARFSCTHLKSHEHPSRFRVNKYVPEYRSEYIRELELELSARRKKKWKKLKAVLKSKEVK